MGELRFSVEKAIGEAAVPPSVPLNPEWGQQFAHNNALQFHLAPGRTAYLFLHAKLLSDDSNEVSELLSKDATVGHLLNCEGQEWVINTEATSDGRFGLIVYTATGKPYLSGEGHFDSSGVWSASFVTLYIRVFGIRKGATSKAVLEAELDRRRKLRSAERATFKLNA